MNTFFTVLENQIFEFNTVPIQEMFKERTAKFGSIIIFVLSIFSKTIAEFLVSNISVSNFVTRVTLNLVGTFLVILLFMVWVTFISAVMKKNGEFYKLLFCIFSSHSPYLILVPVSIILLYFNLSIAYYVIEIFIFFAVVGRVLKFTKLCYNFSDFQVWLIVTLPVIIMSLLIIIPIILGIVLISSGRIQGFML